MWLLQTAIREVIEAAAIANALPTVDQQAQFEASNISAMSDGGSRILSIAGNSAEIAIKGVMTETPSFLAMLFGGGNVTYKEIRLAQAEAERDDNITDITYVVDSPGGTIDGLFEAINVIKNSTKPTKSVVKNKAASAAFALVSATNEIVAFNNAVSFGSIGIAVSQFINKNNVDVTSTNAPKKRPDASTPEGVAVIREELDPIHDLFVEAIATGRNTSAENVNANFGQGGMMLAEEALKRGMIDSIAGTQLQSKVKNTIKTQSAVKRGDNLKVKSMDLATLKADHPAAYAAAVAVGHEHGIAAERDRVGAHLTMGEASGDMKTALAACKDGSEMTATIQAAYMAAGMNKNSIQARDDDDPEASDNLDNANGDDNSDAEAVASGLEEQFGTEVK